MVQILWGIFSYPFLPPQLQELLLCPSLYYVQKSSSSAAKPISSNLAYTGQNPLLCLTRMTTQNEEKIVSQV